MFRATGLIFGGTEGVGSHFHGLRSRARFGKFPRAPYPVFMVCAPGLVLGDNEGVWFCFLVLRFRTHFRRFEGVGSHFHVRTRPDALVPPKMSPEGQNKQMRPNALGTAQNDFGSVKHENGTRRLRYRLKQVRERKT
jgi:hypothetical protein